MLRNLILRITPQISQRRLISSSKIRFNDAQQKSPEAKKVVTEKPISPHVSSLY